jgi:hypothetical protein
MDKNDKPAFSETAPNELKKLGYVPPILQSYNKNGVNVWLTKDENPFWQLEIDGVDYMVLTKNHEQVFQFYPDYNLARGHVICTGLGFGIREQWLASKPEVTKITVLEKFKGVIDYHKYIGTKWSDKIEIINCAADDYKGSCDFLSLDHYSYDDIQSIIDSIKKVCNNITHENVWLWMLEMWIILGYIMGDTHTKNIPHDQKKIRYGGKEGESEGRNNDILENYSKIKTYFEHVNLPNLNEEQLTKFIYRRSERHG